MISFVFVHGKNRELGLNGYLPWRGSVMKEDKKRLHRLVDGKKLVMGEHTYRNYKNIKEKFKTRHVTVLSRTTSSLPDAQVAHSISEIIKRAKNEELWVIGGGDVFAQLLPYADKMYITVIEGEFTADTYFPSYDPTEWNVIEEQSYPVDQKNPYPYTFATYQKKERYLI